MTGTSARAVQHRLTHRDLDDAPDDGNRWEIVDGELYVSPFPTPAHQRAVTKLVKILSTFVDDHRLGEVFTSNLKVVLDDGTAVGPDVVFLSTARIQGLRDDGFYGAPDLIVEVLSSKPGLDRHIKHAKYARAGVPHYWIVDPVRRTLEAFRLEGDRYGLPVELARDAVYEPELFPGLSLPLRDFWM